MRIIQGKKQYLSTDFTDYTEKKQIYKIAAEDTEGHREGKDWVGGDGSGPRISSGAIRVGPFGSGKWIPACAGMKPPSTSQARCHPLGVIFSCGLNPQHEVGGFHTGEFLEALIQWNISVFDSSGFPPSRE
jgi:hypothetical protein